MKYITYNNQQYTKGVSVLKAVEKFEGKEAAEKFYQQFVYPTNLCIVCVVTGKKLTYRTYKISGNRCGTAINLLMRKYKDVAKVKQIVDKTLFYVEELNGYYADWSGMSTSLSKANFDANQKEALYNKYILVKSKCRLNTCSQTVPFNFANLGSCCLLHYNRDTKLKKGKYTTDKLKYECKFDGEMFTSLSRLSVYIKSKGWSEKQYYYKFVDSTANGECKWCNKPVPFHNIEKGYRNFCYNTSCNVLWHNAHKNRNNNGDKISKKHKENQNLPTQKGYWLKKGYSEEESIQKVKERQQTNSIDSIMKRHNCSREEASQIRKNITKKWIDSNKSSIYSKVSQELFWILYDRIKLLFDSDDVFFATYNNGHRDNSGKTREYKVSTKNSYRRLDFYIKSINKCIEFDGAYWHNGINRRGTIDDAKRDAEIIESINCQILHVPEMDFYKNKNLIIDKCLQFILEQTN